jgi:hypothetical protein
MLEIAIDTFCAWIENKWYYNWARKVSHVAKYVIREYQQWNDDKAGSDHEAFSLQSCYAHPCL